MRTSYIKSMFLLTISLLIACSEEDAPNLRISVEADKTEVKVGEPVTFSIWHNAMALSIYTGDDGHDYKTSAYFLLQGLADTDLQNNNYRPIDPEIVPYNCDFANTQTGATTIKDNLSEVINAGSGDNLIGSEAEVEYDESIQQNVLKITSVHPEWWYQALRLNTHAKLGTNKKLNLRMRFDKDILEDVSSGAPRPEITTFQVVIRLGGIGVGETDVIFRDETVWDIYWNPNIAYTDYSVDLSSVIDAWQGATGKTMATLSYIQILFTPSNNAGYLGDYYIASASYGDIDYIPFATGQSLNINDNSGIAKYQYTYTQPGTYQVVVIGTNTSMKNYSNSGYKDNVGNKINASEYNYNTQQSTIDITVHP